MNHYAVSSKTCIHVMVAKFPHKNWPTGNDQFIKYSIRNSSPGSTTTLKYRIHINTAVIMIQ